MKYHFHELKNEIHRWALVELVVLDGQDHPQMIDDSHGEFEIELTINGEHRDFMGIVDLMANQIDRMVEDEAKKQFELRMGDVNNALYDLEQCIRRKYNLFES